MAGWAGVSDFDAKGSSTSDVYEHGASDGSDSNAPSYVVGLPDSLCAHPSRSLVHFYINVPDGEESTYAPSERNIPLDPKFQAHATGSRG